ncbi:MAG: DUF1003 domain-containing protein [Planctomycetes bacterium]|nr:DUF1003 domain-containing protein [Planctomycetota bacterium]
MSHQRAACALCRKEFDRRALIPASGVRPAQFDAIAGRNPEWTHESWICHACLTRERIVFQMSRLAAERGELSEVEADISRKATQHLTMAEDIEKQFWSDATFGQRVADRVAAVGGSWPFVTGFFVFLAAWIGMNGYLATRTFDPYPYILLNLILSCLAAVQAPIIMMSQKRLSARDRMQADHDFRINLKAELEVASLHEKVDHLLHSQWQHMVELQELQIDLLTELAERNAKSK